MVNVRRSGRRAMATLKSITALLHNSGKDCTFRKAARLGDEGKGIVEEPPNFSGNAGARGMQEEFFAQARLPQGVAFVGM